MDDLQERHPASESSGRPCDRGAVRQRRGSDSRPLSKLRPESQVFGRLARPVHRQGTGAPLTEWGGTQEKPVRGGAWGGIPFGQGNRGVRETKEPLLGADWGIYRGGGIFLQGAEDCLLAALLLAQVGGNAIFVNHYTRR